MSANDFRDQLLKGFWHDLKTHLERDAIILVDPNLDLSDVAVSISEDRTETVQEWVAKSLIAKPTSVQIHHWNDMPTKEFHVLIVQPFVLIQEMAH